MVYFPPLIDTWLDEQEMLDMAGIEWTSPQAGAVSERTSSFSHERSGHLPASDSPPPVADHDSVAPALPVSILARTPLQCAWIEGEGTDGFAQCCGARVMRHGLSWCEPHARRVILPSAWHLYVGAAERGDA
ncbi:hypothetical protein [Ancylobacter oerskovii]|uniref:GcrA cell cycle regulator n=1 Tax=Ancylobacter oerskovii TaxID=459519 RepID=A0ABW4Z049_9HYPH|nr:hypothetical protein [Ancylobacter oerskovii]MBS7542993.1 hypothetical protein [Ancylobacter oerskovii]